MLLLHYSRFLNENIEIVATYIGGEKREREREREEGRGEDRK